MGQGQEEGVSVIKDNELAAVLVATPSPSPPDARCQQLPTVGAGAFPTVHNSGGMAFPSVNNKFFFPVKKTVAVEVSATVDNSVGRSICSGTQQHWCMI